MYYRTRSVFNTFQPVKAALSIFGFFPQNNYRTPFLKILTIVIALGKKICLERLIIFPDFDRRPENFRI